MQTQLNLAAPYKIVDLTHSLQPTIPSWDGGCGFHLETKCDYSDFQSEWKFRVQHISMGAGMGTHMDAPAHCIPGGATIDQLPLTQLIAPCILIDVSLKAHERYTVSVEDIEAFEKVHGCILPGHFVMIRTGWEQFWNEPEKYHNNHVFPSVSKEAAVYLLERKIVGLGIDTLSPDRSEDGYPVHVTLLFAGKTIVENVANLEALPPTGSFIFALPINIQGATEAPIRLIALVG